VQGVGIDYVAQFAWKTKEVAGAVGGGCVGGRVGRHGGRLGSCASSRGADVWWTAKSEGNEVDIEQECYLQSLASCYTVLSGCDDE
jgi:hypothetical protein